MTVSGCQGLQITRELHALYAKSLVCETPESHNQTVLNLVDILWDGLGGFIGLTQ